MVTGEVAPDARKPCAIVHEKRPKLGPTAKRAKSAGKRRKGAQCCGNVSKRAGTNGNVWKHRFGWVPGKSVSRFHGPPEKPESGGESAGNRWRGVETCQNGRQQVETCGNNDSDGYRESRKVVFTYAQKTRVRWRVGREPVERCRNNDSDGYRESR